MIFKLCNKNRSKWMCNGINFFHWISEVFHGKALITNKITMGYNYAPSPQQTALLNGLGNAIIRIFMFSVFHWRHELMLRSVYTRVLQFWFCRRAETDMKALNYYEKRNLITFFLHFYIYWYSYYTEDYKKSIIIMS